MLIAGVDVGSRHSAICRISTEFGSVDGSVGKNEVWWSDLDRRPGDSFADYLKDVGFWAERHLEYVDVVWIEQPFGNNPRALFQLGAVAGAIASTCAPNTDVEFVSSSEWKKLIGLSGNAKKAVVQQWARDEGRVGLTEHATDAYGMARAILAHGAKEK